MATCRATVNLALRKMGRLAAGREARPVDAEDAFEALKGTYRFLITSGAFGRLCDAIPLSDYTARPNERVVRTSPVITITLPDRVQYGYGGPYDYGRPLPYPYSSNQTLTDGVTTPRDGSIIVVVDEETGLMSDFIYDGTIKQWLAVNGVIVDGMAVQPLTLDSNAPMSVRDPSGLASLLAVRISDEWGGTVQPATLQQAQQYTTGLTSNFSFPRVEAPGSFF